MHCRFVYDGRYDKYIEPDDEWEEADVRYGVPVLATSAAISGIGMWSVAMVAVVMTTVCRRGDRLEGSGLQHEAHWSDNSCTCHQRCSCDPVILLTLCP